MINTDCHLQTNAMIKIRFPSPLTKDCWAIEEPSQKSLTAVPFIVVLMSVACVKPIAKSSLFEFLLSKVNFKVEQLEKILKELFTKNIITFVEVGDIPLVNNFLNWTKFGWGEAANYHFSTWDASFLDYSKEGGGHDFERKLMAEYQKLEPDTSRFKIHEGSQDRIELPDLGSLSAFDLQKESSVLTRIKYLLSFAFGKKGEKSCHWNDTPLIKRTSPSGGSRHPTEGYFFPVGLQEMKKGFYHVQTEPTSLSLLSGEKEDFLAKFNIENDPQLPVCGAIILTTVFERNMYRYREPRTFRTIHMDIGHILETLELLGKEFSLKTRIHLSFNEDAILQQIGASKLDEGVMAVVTLHEEKN